ncbi:AAA family ATPase [Gloeothece verrucosa]|uniref:SMC domain protein n=1 Tax=Gloeothece verrucosa (strain PCC 7822) TaxID=497965 RepID=E0U910_GLOV7|nr:ATP-binding protein [Gloeothece verrucosa]ADN16149.1 SMC domain protein [Gloeothece verrucosa PCC 7822]
MLKKIRFKNFKNFQDAELSLGNFTLLVGENATGKSNIRDALRFLHGIARGYNIAEIIGEKWIEGGALQWSGIRGGTREIAFKGASSFSLEAAFSFLDYQKQEQELIYQIEVKPGENTTPSQVVSESLFSVYDESNLFYSQPSQPNSEQELTFILVNKDKIDGKEMKGKKYQPFISEICNAITSWRFQKSVDYTYDNLASSFSRIPSFILIQNLMRNLSSIRFFDLEPAAMKNPSYPGQNILGERGENLSSVLLDLYQIPDRKIALLEWIKALTPMDVVDFEFPTDFTGKTLVTLVESNGEKISAYSASDGTLRFLAICAALLTPNPAKFYFFEEIENGIHPTRLHLLIQLIEQATKQENIQVLATSHSPQLLRLLSSQSLEYASLTYRLPEKPGAKIQRILDIPEAKEVLEQEDLGRLHESGWLEDIMYFSDDEE